MRRSWIRSLRRTGRAPGRIRVGIGPIRTGENELGTRGWRIDPVVDGINRKSTQYVCGVFFEGERLAQFDIVLVVKHLMGFDLDEIRQLKERGTVFLYSAADPNLERLPLDGDRARFLGLMDGIILGSPVQDADFSGFPACRRYIPTAVINTLHKIDYRARGPVRIIWQGYKEQLFTLKGFDRIVAELATSITRPIEFVCHTDLPTSRRGMLQYVKWTKADSFTRLVDADIGVSVKPPGDIHQQRKPPTKLITYMSCGLPVVCTPSPADRLVIEPGRTGFFAFSPAEWVRTLRALVEDDDLRRVVGSTGREHVMREYAPERIADAHIGFFEHVRAARTAAGVA